MLQVSVVSTSASPAINFQPQEFQEETIPVKKSDLAAIASAYWALASFEGVLSRSMQDPCVEHACILKFIIDRFPNVIESFPTETDHGN